MVANALSNQLIPQERQSLQEFVANRDLYR